MAADDDAKRRFADYVKLVAKDDRFISRDEERGILEEGVTRFNTEMDQARGIMYGVADENDYAIERDVDRCMQAVLERFAGKRGVIDRKRFEDATAIYSRLTHGAITGEDARKRVKAIVEERGWKIRRAGPLGTKRWYTRIGKERRRLGFA
jgi:hypothetical protein